ncbi:MAG: right-handed parallel beta-helix repeat-containing protein [Pseudomonadota bacterium]
MTVFDAARRMACRAWSIALLAALSSSPFAAEIRIEPIARPPDTSAIERQRIEREIEQVERRVAAFAPPALRPGDARVQSIDTLAAVRKSYIGAARATPSWSDEALVLADGVWDLGSLQQHSVAQRHLSCPNDQVCELRRPLLIEAGATLWLHDTQLRLSQAHGAFVASYGDLIVTDNAAIAGWDVDTDAPARTEGDAFRPFIVVFDKGRLVAIDSTFKHLGFDEAVAYGLSISTSSRNVPASDHPQALVYNSEIDDLFYAFYTFEAEQIDLVGNHITNSHRYGIDPHDFTRDLLITRNDVSGTKERHGIIASRGVEDLIIFDNKSHNNAGTGIMLDRATTNALVIENLVHDNGADGVAVYESHDITLADNLLQRNASRGLRIRNSRAVSVRNNRIEENGTGIEIYARMLDEPPGTRPRTNYETRVSAQLAGNQLDRNRDYGCILKNVSKLTLLPGPGDRSLAPCEHPNKVAGDQIWVDALLRVWFWPDPLELSANQNK